MTAITAGTGPMHGPNIIANDRLGLTIFFAVVLHSILILGISFSQPEKRKLPEKLPGLEITMVQTKSDKNIEEADFLAQANQEGGGDAQKPEKPSTPVEAAAPTGEMGEVTETVPQTMAATSVNPQNKEILTATRDSDFKLKVEQASQNMQFDASYEASKQLLKQSKEMARLSAEVDVSRAATSKQKDKKYLTAQTKEYRFASYEESWRKKVERIGTLNFPDDAKRQHLSGDLRMTVKINSDGTLKDVIVTKFSGHKILDDAAVRIVKMAAPFERFPDDIRKDYDEIVIIRTWQFLPGNKVKTTK